MNEGAGWAEGVIAGLDGVGSQEDDKMGNVLRAISLTGVGECHTYNI